MRAARRLDGFGTSIFSEITRLSVELGAVNLGQGFPDFPAPDFVKEAAARAIAADHNQYAPAPGIIRLRRAIADRFNLLHGTSVDPDTQVTIAGGATEAIFDTVMALVDPGDEVVVLEPFYDSYVPSIRMAGGIPRIVTMQAPGWHWRSDELAAAFGPRTKLLIVNTPHNPTGKVLSTAELDELAALCIRHDVIAVCDEVYSDIVFAGSRHIPLATRPGMAERTVTVDSLGKTFSVTGWKIGWSIAPVAVAAAIRGVHQFVTFCNSTPLQEAAADAIMQAGRNGYYDQLKTDYTARRDLLKAVLDGADLPTLPIGGSYFLLADITRFADIDDTAFCLRLTKEVGVAAIPPAAFYADQKRVPRMARFCFAKSDESLRIAGRRLAKL